MLEDTLNAEDLEPPGRHRGTYYSAIDYPLHSIDLADTLGYPKPHIQGIHESSRAALFLSKFFPEASITDWNDWRWQLCHRIVDIGTLSHFLHFSDDEQAMDAQPLKGFPMAVFPCYASLLDRDNPRQPLRLTMVPTIAEKVPSPGEAINSLGEDHDSPFPGIVHQYLDTGSRLSLRKPQELVSN
jgi:hypothetical protein